MGPGLGVWLLLLPTALASLSDVDSADAGSDTSSTSDVDMDLDNSDPNLVNPQKGEVRTIIFMLNLVFLT